MSVAESPSSEMGGGGGVNVLLPFAPYKLFKKGKINDHPSITSIQYIHVQLHVRLGRTSNRTKVPTIVLT